MKKYVLWFLLCLCFLFKIQDIHADETMKIVLDSQNQSHIVLSSSTHHIEIINQSTYDIQIKELTISTPITFSYQDYSHQSLDEINTLLKQQTLAPKQSFLITLDDSLDQEETLLIQWDEILVEGQVLEKKTNEYVDKLKIDLWKDCDLLETAYSNEKGFYYLKVPSLLLTNQKFTISYNDFQESKQTISLPYSQQTLHQDLLLEPQKYQLIYDDQMNHTICEQYTPNQIISLINQDTFHKTGYHLIGWSDGYQDYALNATITMPRHDVQLHALWQKDTQQKRPSAKKMVKKTKMKQVKTEDETSILMLSLLLLMSLSIFIVLKVLKKK
ncbi:hypothetical protein [Longibaculum muris]|uniref:hypothetical protein n=1 Tax=Longibaculum muris TaxID=1796628 RepID=UPI0029427EA6|nr:hypothetical protein [Longibaculum muris]